MAPYIVAMLATSPPPMTNHGLDIINRTLHPLLCKALAVIPMIPMPSPVCKNVSFRYALSESGMPPSRVSRLKTKFAARIVPPTMAAPYSKRWLRGPFAVGFILLMVVSIG